MTTGPSLHHRRELVLTLVALGFALVTIALLVVSLADAARAELQRGWEHAAGALLFTGSVGAILYGSTVYLVVRLGWVLRNRAHRPATRSQIDAAVLDGGADPLVVLVPSYREDPAVVRQTLLSAALQDYPDRRVVLLLDDPPGTTDPDTRAVRELPQVLESMLGPMAQRLHAARCAFEARSERPLDVAHEQLLLAELYDDVARWFADQGGAEPRRTHIDHHFVATTFDARVEEMRRLSSMLRLATGRPCDPDELHRLYRRLDAAFDVTVEVFERKQFANLSHEPNKAMNLNAYLGLLGGSFDTVERPDGRHLVATDEGGDLEVRDATWIVTLDADSLLVHDYASRLVEQLGRPGMERVAVIQTPYSAVPGATGAVERTAGATTDIMHVVHQGMTAYDATYWVGANALLRRTALQELVTYVEERGHRVPRFIQDRTVIEDTESSIDLVSRGWSLYNYPDRLAFSATPQDYGSLLVQRRRWANGGLIILPKLLRHVLSHPGPRSWLTALLRVHYLVSIASVNVALLVLMCVPFDDALSTALLPLTCVPYFVLYARDLRIAGYRPRDLLQVYALNLLLTPVNLGGVAKSLQQAVTGRRIPFGRTPKVTHRTPAPPLYIAATLALLALWGTSTALDVAAGRWSHAFLVAGNVAVLTLAIARFVGWRNCLADLTPWTSARSGGRAPVERGAHRATRRGAFSLAGEGRR